VNEPNGFKINRYFVHPLALSLYTRAFCQHARYVFSWWWLGNVELGGAFVVFWSSGDLFGI